MSYSNVGYVPVATRDETTRADFVVQVYQHLVGAVVAFIVFEALLINLGVAEGIYDFVTRNSAAWLLILGAFMVGQSSLHHESWSSTSQ